jgi:LPS export ABC transporter protein LptC
MKGSLIEFLFGALLAAGLLAVVGCSDHQEFDTAGGADSLAAVTRPDQQIRDARIFLYNGSVRTTDLEADYIEKYEKQDSTLAWDLKVHFFDSTGREISYLVADSGLVRERTNSMEVFGDVVVTAEDSVILKTDNLFYDARKDSILTDAYVTIIQKGDTIRGYGLQADRQLRKTRIKRQVTGSLKNTEGILK